MNRQTTTLLVITSILILFLFTGFPIEFRGRFSERVARILISILVILTFFIVFYVSKKLHSKKLRIAFTVLTIIIALPYSLICIYNFSTAISGNYSRWKDISILEEKDGNKIAHQLRETSGSIYDYRYRKIFYENESIRISVNCDWGKLTGWSQTKSN